MARQVTKPRPRKYNRGQIYIVSIVVVAMAFISFFLYSHYTKSNRLELEPSSYAARRGITSSSAPVIIEGEAISTYSPSGGLQVIDDVTASGEKALQFSINTTANTQVTLPENTSILTVMAKGERCKGNPGILVKVDEQSVLDKNISSTSWNDYTVNVDLASGTHNVSLSFTNDLISMSGNVCDRSLKVDQLIFQ